MRRRRRAAARSASDAPRDLYGRSTPRGGPREIVSTLGDRPECSSSRVQDGPGAETIVAVGLTSPRAHFLPRSTGETPAQSPGGGWRRAAAVPGRRLAASGWPGRVASCGGRFDKPRPQPAGTEAPEGTGGDLRSTGPVAANKSAVPDRRRVPRSPALRPANLVPGTVPRIAPRTSLAVQPAPSGKTKCTTQGRATTRRLSTNVRRDASDLSPNLAPLWTGCGYTHRGGVAWVVGSLD